MPSFLSKLFRKKKGPDEVSTSASKASSKKSRKSSKKKNKVDKNVLVVSDTASDLVKTPQAQELRRPSNGGTSNYSSNSGSEPRVRVLSPRNQVPSMMERHVNEDGMRAFSHFPNNKTKPPQHGNSYSAGNGGKKHGDVNQGWGGPVDLDESDLGSDTDENQLHARGNKLNANHHANSNVTQQQRLSVQQLHRFDMQQQKREGTAQFYMAAEETPKFSAGHVPVPDDMNRSDASSSSFNLSTDAEDTEYEALKRRGVLPNPNALDSSHLSGVSSPTNYNTDGDNSIFPALQTDDEGTATERESHPCDILPSRASDEDEGKNRGSISRHANLNSHPNKNKQRLHTLSTSEDDEERAWTISPTKDGTNSFPFHNHNPTSPGTKRHSVTSSKVARSPNSFTTSALSTSRVDTSNEFANFADFSNVTFPADTASWGTASNKIATKIAVDGSNSSPISPGRKAHRPSSSTADMTLSDILAQAKGKRTSTGSHRSTGSGSHHNRRSSSSLNSAPAITAKYLRQHHNLKSSSRHSNEHDGTTPVSDIIDSLEMANASRSSHHSATAGSGCKSVSRSSDASRSAKERMKERRRRDREYSSSSRRRSDPNQTTESSDGSDQEASESWLFDEVTGALGPRGIAADLESLSGRSKSSSGNKSHKSHRSHRSHRSHGRSRRRKSSSKNNHHPSSGESVDSRGSRHSRGSRYSHRSTRSYLSQMSEQSRSVANDLLRLEMQLAMVGSQDNNAAAAAAAAGSSASVASRASRKSRSSASRRTVAIARRNKVTIQAPPGKLGIILANKADSKGTVVSGVRSSSVLSEKISPGDRIVAIDGEDVSLMTVSEITTIMARKSDFERTLTVLTTPKHIPSGTASSAHQCVPEPCSFNGMGSPSRSKDYDPYQNRYNGGR